RADAAQPGERGRERPFAPYQQRGHGEDPARDPERPQRAQPLNHLAAHCSRSGRKPTSASLPRCARLPWCSASCFASSVATARFLRFTPETASDLPSVNATSANWIFSGSASSCTPTPPFGRTGTSSREKISRRASDESAAT